jgi:hypothetical protein
MNYKAIALNTLNEYAEKNPEYSLGQLLYSFIRKPISGITKLNELNTISDEDMYTIIEKAKDEENDEPFIKE